MCVGALYLQRTLEAGNQPGTGQGVADQTHLVEVVLLQVQDVADAGGPAGHPQQSNRWQDERLETTVEMVQHRKRTGRHAGRHKNARKKG